MLKSPHDDATGCFNIDAFIRDLTTMAPTITHVMTMDQGELSRLCLKRMREQGGREEIETAAAALSDLAKRAHSFASVATEAWLYLMAELNDPGGRAP